jgi:hypothetical protein
VNFREAPSHCQLHHPGTRGSRTNDDCPSLGTDSCRSRKANADIDCLTDWSLPTRATSATVSSRSFCSVRNARRGPGDSESACPRRAQREARAFGGPTPHLIFRHATDTHGAPAPSSSMCPPVAPTDPGVSRNRFLLVFTSEILRSWIARSISTPGLLPLRRRPAGRPATPRSGSLHAGRTP